MEDFKTMWNKMLSMPGNDNLEKIDAYLDTMTADEGDRFLLMIQEPSKRIPGSNNQTA